MVTAILAWLCTNEGAVGLGNFRIVSILTSHDLGICLQDSWNERRLLALTVSSKGQQAQCESAWRGKGSKGDDGSALLTAL